VNFLKYWLKGYWQAQSWRKKLKISEEKERDLIGIGSKESLTSFLDDNRSGKHADNVDDWVLYLSGAFDDFYPSWKELLKAIPEPRFSVRSYDVFFKKIGPMSRIHRSRNVVIPSIYEITDKVS